MYPTLLPAAKVMPDKKRLFIGAYGFEQRSLGWSNYQEGQGAILTKALMFRYKHSKGKNRISELCKSLAKIGVSKPKDIVFDILSPHNFENVILNNLVQEFVDIDEIVVDISSMTKLLILVSLCMLGEFNKTVRIVYSESEAYAPTKQEYDKSKEDATMIAQFPSHGVETIIRTKCLSSIRMQGQPVTLIAFTSFNEQLVRHILGTISPHRLLFINGRPPREDYAWRERATKEIHKKLIEEYQTDNPVNEEGNLLRVASTLYYNETIDIINKIYDQYGALERIISVATGSKMQTVGLFFSKMTHPDIHIEYPTPDSYHFARLSTGVRAVHEIVISHFSGFLKSIREIQQNEGVVN